MQISNQPLSKQFSQFVKNNNFANMADALEYFAVFGGTDFKINPKYSLETTIENYILNKYKYLRNDINQVVNGNEKYPSILTALVLGDRRTNSAFRRVDMSFDDGIDLVDELCKIGVLKLEKSLQSLSNHEDQYVVSEKLLFINPFVRFWFAFISPIFQGIRDGNYDEFWKNFENRKQEFIHMIFEQLAHELIKEEIGMKNIYQIGRYWDDDTSIELLVKTKDNKHIAGAISYANSKCKKSLLSQLKQSCKDAKIDIDKFVLFGKNGFSSELKSQKGDDLKLFTVKSLKGLV